MRCEKCNYFKATCWFRGREICNGCYQHFRRNEKKIYNKAKKEVETK